MPKQKMRWQIFLDLPVNVSNREYVLYTLRCVGAGVCLLVGAGLFFHALKGSATDLADELGALPTLTMNEVSSATMSRGPIRMEGLLVASEPAVMPDEPGLDVAYGRLGLRAVLREAGAEPKSAMLYEWRHAAESLWLEVGKARLMLRLDVEQLPMTEARSPAAPKRIGDGAAVRLSKTVGYEFAGAARMLPSAWEPSRNVRSEVERAYVANRAPVVVVGELVPTGEGSPTLVVRDGDRSVFSGTLDRIRSEGQGRAKFNRVAWLPLLLAGAWLVRSALRKRAKFVARSNAL